MIKIFYVALFTIILNTTSSNACMSQEGRIKTEAHSLDYFFNRTQREPAQNMEIVKFAKGHNNPSWEARLGNLLLENSDSNSDRVTISVPAVLSKSSYHPFGDGQSNAKLSMGESWKLKDFLVVGFETQKGSQFKRHYVFHSSLNIQEYNEKSLGDSWYQVTPKDWNDSFYFNFNSGVYGLNQFLSAIPEGLRKFSSNRLAPDPAGVRSSENVAETLKKGSLGEGYNSQAWYATNVHGLFPSAQGQQTALGGVLTWGIVEPQFGPFKHLYTCFESRQAFRESELGIPSGSGWHHVGDAAESILNTLESERLPIAIARSHAKSQAAYGLSESLTATWLNKNEVFVTKQGEFHWYLNPYNRAVCTEIWVHKCVPNSNNAFGFQCP